MGRLRPIIEKMYQAKSIGLSYERDKFMMKGNKVTRWLWPPAQGWTEETEKSYRSRMQTVDAMLTSMGGEMEGIRNGIKRVNPELDKTFGDIGYYLTRRWGSVPYQYSHGRNFFMLGYAAGYLECLDVVL